jgi:hypothetical protein
MAIDGRIGGAHFELTVNAAGFKNQMAAAESSAASSTRGISRSVDGVSGSIKEATRGAREFRQSVGAVVGTAGAIVAAVVSIKTAAEELYRIFRDGGGLAEQFGASLSRMPGDVSSDLEKVRKQIAGVQAELENAMSGKWWDIGGVTSRRRAQIEEELKALVELESSLSRQRTAQILRQKDRERTEELKKQTSELKKQLDLSQQIATALRGDYGPESVVFGFTRLERAIVSLQNRMGRSP